jgi:hypothetical protein
LIGFPVAMIQSLINGLSLLRFRHAGTRVACSDSSILVFTASALLVEQGFLSYFINGQPGHIEWLALPDLTFPIVLLAFSCWAITVMVNEKTLLLDLLIDLLSARLIILLFQIGAQSMRHGVFAPTVGNGFTDWIQEGTELWWLLAVMVRLGRLPFEGKIQRKQEALLVWGAFLGPWMFWLVLFQPADLWQAEGADSDPKHYSQVMSEDTFTAQSLMFDGMLDTFEAERTGVEDVFFLGVAGEAGNPLYLKEAELAIEVVRDVYGTDGRAAILANSASEFIRYPFATHNNFSGTLNRIGEMMDVEDDVLFLFLTSRGTQSSSFVLSQPGLALSDIDPKGLKNLLDVAEIKWRIIVISACYSGGFIDALQDPNTLIITSSDKTEEGMGCVEKKGSTAFTRTFFDTYLKKAVGITAAFNATLADLQTQQGPAKKLGLPQMQIGTEIKKKLAGLEAAILQPGALKDGLRAQRNLPFAKFRDTRIYGTAGRKHSRLSSRRVEPNRAAARMTISLSAAWGSDSACCERRVR